MTDPLDRECLSAAEATCTAVRVMPDAGVSERALAFGLVVVGQQIVERRFGAKVAANLLAPLVRAPSSLA